MMFRFGPFKQLDWLIEGGKARYDLSGSDLSPKWPGIYDDVVEDGLIDNKAVGGSRELISFLAQEYDVPEDRVLLTNGCSEANTFAFLSSVGPGSRVLLEKPIYSPLVELPRAMGCRISFIKRRPDEYSFDLGELDDKLKAGVDILVLQNHNNPTGKGLFEHQQKEIASVCDRYGVPVLVDEVYRDFTLQTDEDGTMRQQIPSMVSNYSRALITSSVTKVYGAGGLMAGWLIGPRRHIRRAAHQKLMMVPLVSHLSTGVALEVLRRRGTVLPAKFEEIRSKLRLVSMWAKGRSDLFWSEPDGCPVGFLRYTHDLPSAEVCRRLLRERSVKVVPGEFFHIEKGFRMGLNVDYNVLREGLARIDSFFDEL